MTLSKRETVIAWALGAALGAFVLYYAANWWVEQRAGLEDKKLRLKTQVDKDNNTIRVGKNDVAEFERLKIQILDPSRPDLAPTDRLVQTTFNGGGLTFTQWAGAGARPALTNKDFLEAKYTVTATTTTSRLAYFLQYIENAQIPAKIDSMTITTPKPGVDSLRVEFSVSALIYLPKPAATAPASRGGAGGGGGPEATKPATTSRSGSRPATGTASRPAGRAGSRPATTTASKPATKPASTQDLALIEQQMAEKRLAEAARLATLPAPGPPLTYDEIEQKLILRRQEQDRLADAVAASRPASPTTAPTAPGGTQ